MGPFLSINLWLLFLNRTISEMHPLTLVLFIIALVGLSVGKQWKELITSFSFRLFLICFILDFAIRIYLFFTGLLWQGRYMLPFTIFMVFFAAKGVFDLSSYIARRYEHKSFVNYRRVLVVIILIVSSFYVGKAMCPRLDKKYLRKIPAAIVTNCPKGRKPVIISMVNEPRFAYYANARNLLFDRAHYPSQRDWGILSKGEGRDSDQWTRLKLPSGVKNLAANIKKLGGSNVFIVSNMQRTQFTSAFSRAGVTEPVKFLGKFHVKHDRYFYLYQGVGS